MSLIMNEYKEKLVSADQAASMIKSGDSVDMYAYSAYGQALDKALAKRVHELENVKIRTAIIFNRDGWEVFKADPEGKVFWNENIFVDGHTLKLASERRASIPALFHEYPRLFERGDWTADFGSLQVSPPDDEGYLHFSITTAYAKALAKGVKCFIAEINNNLFPIANGHEESKIHISEVDYIIEGENPALTQLADPVPREKDRKIANYIINELSDGCCFQIGFGTVPMAVVSLIAESDLKDLGVHTEMFSDGLMKLYQEGKVTGNNKNIDRGLMTSTLVAGTTECYEFAKTNKDLYIAPVSYTNDPNVIGQIDNFVSINACLEVDITGQVNSETIGTTQISGSGGQYDFVMGAYRSKNGKSIVCCPSTYKKKDGSLGSRIKAVLSPGTGLTNLRASVQYVCTEHGIVNIKGKNMWDRAESLISIAHPDFREELIKDAEKYGIWRRSNKR